MNTDNKFQKIIAEVKKDKNILAFWVDGSRGKKMETKYSDYDAKMIVKDKVLQLYRRKYGNREKSQIEIGVFTLDGLKKHAEYGTKMVWDRYNFAHLKPLFDRTGKIKKIMREKARMPKKKQKVIINNALGAFINQVFRAEKNLRDGIKKAAKLEVIEGIPFFLEAIFALEGRVRPYNKYLEWELNKYPLTKFPWKKGELIKKLDDLLDKNKISIFHNLFITIRPIFKKNGYTRAFDEWKGCYKVGE